MGNTLSSQARALGSPPSSRKRRPTPWGWVGFACLLTLLGCDDRSNDSQHSNTVPEARPWIPNSDDIPDIPHTHVVESCWAEGRWRMRMDESRTDDAGPWQPIEESIADEYPQRSLMILFNRYDRPRAVFDGLRANERHPRPISNCSEAPVGENSMTTVFSETGCILEITRNYQVCDYGDKRGQGGRFTVDFSGEVPTVEGEQWIDDAAPRQVRGHLIPNRDDPRDSEAQESCGESEQCLRLCLEPQDEFQLALAEDETMIRCTIPRWQREECTADGNDRVSFRLMHSTLIWPNPTAPEYRTVHVVLDFKADVLDDYSTESFRANLLRAGVHFSRPVSPGSSRVMGAFATRSVGGLEDIDLENAPIKLAYSEGRLVGELTLNLEARSNVPFGQPLCTYEFQDPLPAKIRFDLPIQGAP